MSKKKRLGDLNVEELGGKFLKIKRSLEDSEDTTVLKIKEFKYLISNNLVFEGTKVCHCPYISNWQLERGNRVHIGLDSIVEEISALDFKNKVQEMLSHI